MAGLISSVQSLSRVRLFATLWTTACWASLSITNSWSLLKLMSIESAMPSNLMVTSTRTYVNSCLLGWLLPMLLSPQQATVDPCLCRRPPNTHSQVWLSLLWGSLFLPMCHDGPKVLFVPHKSLCFPQSYASSVSKSSLAFKVLFPWGSQVSGHSQCLCRCYIIELAPLGQATCLPSAQLLGWGEKINYSINGIGTVEETPGKY